MKRTIEYLVTDEFNNRFLIKAESHQLRFHDDVVHVTFFDKNKMFIAKFFNVSSLIFNEDKVTHKTCYPIPDLKAKL